MADRTTKLAAPAATANYKVMQPFYLDTKLLKEGETVELAAVDAAYLGEQVQPAPASNTAA